jgi:hypothetical protein
MRTRLLTAAASAVIVTLATGGAEAAYEGGWYKVPFWSGEYPNGITMESDTTTMLRAAPDPDAPQTIECTLPQGATYHPWNIPRVESDQLEFVTFSPIIENVVVADGMVFAYPPLSMEAIELNMQAGDTWEFLAYLGEGFFVMRYQGVVYEAGQELYEFSEAAGAAADDRQSDEWLRLTCSNGARGWLRVNEVVGTPGFGSTPITNYGEASDVE